MAFIKICGMTDEQAVSAALAADVDAIGFVFAPSVRRIAPQIAVKLAVPARGKVLCVAVTQHPDAELLKRILEVFKPDVLQTDATDLASIVLPSGVAAWPVVRGSANGATPATRVLFEGPRSGTGKVADWSAARHLARSCELILAGGLAPGNVAEAIGNVQPFGVDVSSGVESQPGKKDPQLIAEFVRAARAAFARLKSGVNTK
jgi:phosphoribosylanthranilate isomerase